MKSREKVDKLKVEGTVYEDVLQQAEAKNKSFQTVFTREIEFRINNIITMEYLMENVKVDVKDGKSRCKKSNGSRWSVKLDNERMQ